MSVKIRKGMFETNSSSAHVLAIRKKILEDRDYPIADEIRSHIDTQYSYIVAKHKNDLRFERWPFDLLTSINDKIRYLSAYSDGEDNDEILKILQSYCPECKRLIFPTEKDVKFVNRTTGLEVDRNFIVDTFYLSKEWLVEMNGCLTDDIMELTVRNPYYGYVDHQSCGLLYQTGKNGKPSLKDIIVNKNIFIVIDGDEYCNWRKLAMAGLIDPNQLEHEELTDDSDSVKGDDEVEKD